MELRFCCAFFLVVLVNDSVYVVQGKSFGNLVKSVTLGTGTTAEPDKDYIYKTGPSCVMFATNNRPYFDASVGNNQAIRLVLLYLPKDTRFEDIEVVTTSSSTWRQLNLSASNIAHQLYQVVQWQGNKQTSYIRVQSSNSFSVCLLKVYDITLDEYCECSDECHRNADVICENACNTILKNCTRVNVALRKLATMSTLYKTQDASYAVNGITGTTFSGSGYTNDTTQWNCVHTDPLDSSPFWEVNLGQQFTIKYLTIYRRSSDDERRRIAGVRITVDDKPCRVINYNEASEERMDLSCNTPHTGQVVKLSRSRSGEFVNLCEVQVWVCKSGYYGQRCSTPCSKHCKNADCDISNGTCIHGCEAGWYLPTCSLECSRGCPAGQCNSSDGECGPCLANWTGNRCQECDSRHYGNDCIEDCGHCKDDSSCEGKTGRCLFGCEPGYKPNMCKETCDLGYYGANCELQCSSGCKDKTCDHVTGHCSCGAGWRGQHCSDNCKKGTYGQDCAYNCSKGCWTPSSCEHVTGNCTCRPGYKNARCNRNCDAGQYGQNCTMKCSEGCRDNQCNPEDGKCQCASGWKPGVEFCTEKCDPGFYGNCSTQCGQCAKEDKDCDHVTGHCSEQLCKDGFSPPLCVEKLIIEDVQPGPNITAIILGLLACLLIVGLLVFAVIYVRKRKSQSGPKSETNFLSNTQEEPQERLYANSGQTGVFFQPSTNGSGSVSCHFQNTASREVYRANDRARDVEDDDYLDLSDDDLSVVEDARWSQYQSIKISLDPVQQYLLDKLTVMEKLTEEFKELPAGMNKPCTIGALEENKPKNRFKRLMPYDHTRVNLQEFLDDPASNYINANYIRNLQDEQAYIATQGPLRNTVGDLWRMVWQEKVTQIVMLTNLQEKDKAKCHQYWPEKGERVKHGDITVVGEDVHLRADFYIRIFHLLKAKTNNPREVTQYHMVVWPDHGVPSALALLNLQRYVSARSEPNSGPLLVHCSAGVGRSGTYIALDLLLHDLKEDSQLDVLKVVKRMREDRVIMIQTVDQYVVLHEVLLEAYTSRNTRIKLDELETIFPLPVTADTDNPRIDREFKKLCQMKNFLSKPKYTIANLDENKAKNRDRSVLADDAHLVYLSAHVSGRNQYINAVSMPSFRQQRGMLLTQLPLPDTVVDLWRLVESFKVATIVSLGSKEEEKKGYCHYWPRTDKSPIKAGPYVIKMTSSEVLGDALTSYSLTLEKADKPPRNLCLLHLMGWAGDIPEGTSDLLHLLNTLDTIQSQDRDVPIIVQCKDGAKRSGICCALINIISRMTYDRDLDVYLTVRQVQSARPQAITSKAHYRFCYQVALQYKKTLDVYANY